MEKKNSLRSRLIRFLGAIPASEADRMARRAYEAGVEDSPNDEPRLNLAGGGTITTGYKSVTATPRDLSAISQEKAIEAAYRLWNTNPLGKVLVEILVNNAVGQGVTVTADNEQVQAVLDKFWLDPVNALGQEEGGVGNGLEQISRELLLFGEQLLLAFARTGEDVGGVVDGLVRLGSLDPSRIHSIITDKDNRKDILAVRIKSASGGADGPVYRLIRSPGKGKAMEGYRDLPALRTLLAKGRRLSESQAARTVREVRGREWLIDGENGKVRIHEANDEDILAEAKPVGECFYFRINNLSTGVRGRSMLLPLIDWLDRLDQVFFDGAEHISLLNMFSWDVTVTGGSETSAEPETNLTKQAEKVAKLKQGSVYAHNEKVAIAAKNPDLKSTDLETTVRMLRIFIAGGAQIPEHWLSEGNTTNRATAAEMGQPTYQMLEHYQGIIKSILIELCQYQIDVAVALGLIPEEVPVLNEQGVATGETVQARRAFRIDMPDINPADTEMAARAFGEIAQAILPLVAGNILPKQPALELLAQVASLLGVTIDVNKILEEEQTGPEPPEVDQAMLDMLSGDGNKPVGVVND